MKSKTEYEDSKLKGKIANERPPGGGPSSFTHRNDVNYANIEIKETILTYK